jgi:hypothetical protein
MALTSAIVTKLPLPASDAVFPNLEFEETTSSPRQGAPIMTAENTRKGTNVLEEIRNGQFLPVGGGYEPLELSSTASKLDSSPSSPRFFEVLYDHLGRRTGRYGSPQAQQEVLRCWMERGTDGASWLVRRVAKERHLEAIDGASIALEAMSDAAAPYIIAILNTSTLTVSAGDAETAMNLFRILEWFPAKDVIAFAARLAEIVERTALLSTVELREAAYRCIPLLPNAEAVRRHILAVETDPELRELLQLQNR